MKPKLTILLAALLAASGCSRPDPSVSTTDEGTLFDVLIVGGEVADGGGTQILRTNIGIVGNRIVDMAASPDAKAVTRIDATGLLIAPGFIDPHTHALEDLLSGDRNANLGFLKQGVTTVIVGNDGFGVPNLDDSLATMRSRGIGTNVAFYAGHNDIRATTMGLENRPATDQELQEMRDNLEAQMEAGALGLSTGLYYTPGSYAPTEEVISLAKVAAQYGGIYDSHIRDESSYSIGLLGAVQEVIEVGERADIPVHIAHLKALGRDVWGKSADVIATINKARERGVEVTADQYPYRASGTSFSSALIPAWVRADSYEAMLERIDSPELRGRIIEEIEANLWRRGGAESLLVTGADSEWRGMTLEQVAAVMETDPVTAAVEVVRGGDTSIASFNMSPEDIYAIAVQDWVMTGSDGSDGHPRKYATYPVVYRDMVLAQGLFPVETFIERSSGRVADALGICDRGYLREGLVADIVMIDLDTYVPVADFQNPTALATGVVHALVNGLVAIKDSEPVAELNGEVVNRQGMDCS